MSERELLLPSDGERRRGEDRKDRTKLENGFHDLLSHAAPGACACVRERAPSTERRTGWMHLAKLTFRASQSERTAAPSIQKLERVLGMHKILALKAAREPMT